MKYVRKGGGNEDRRVRIEDEAIVRLFSDGLTAVEIGAQMRCSAYPIKQAFQRLGLKRPAKRRPGVGAGSSNPAWKGGRRVRSDGYVVVWTKDGERLEHRVVMEAHLGRALADDKIVHHRDGNKSNNDPGNLEVMTQSRHAAIHALELLAARHGHKGRHNPRAKLTMEHVRMARESTQSARSLAKKFGVHPSTINRIRNGTGWNNGE